MPPQVCEDDEAGRFLQEAQRVVEEAQRIVESLPDVEIHAIELAIRQLCRIRDILRSLEDEYIPAAQNAALVSSVVRLTDFLQESLANINPPSVPAPTSVATGRKGRPPVQIDLANCQRLHKAGNSWSSIAEAHGISRQTLYNHFGKAGLPTARKSFAEITDYELDELVAAITLERPFIGQHIVIGHLEHLGLHVPVKRVELSLRCVDDVGVMIR